MKLSKYLFTTLRHNNEWFLDNGLYGGAKIRFTDRVSPHGNRTRRKMELNMRWKHLHSPTLNRPVRVRLTTDVLVHIDEVGGLDNYIMGQERLDGLKAEAIKKALVMRQWRVELEEKGLELSYSLSDYGKRV